MGQAVCEWIAFFSAYVRSIVVIGLLYGTWGIVAGQQKSRRTKAFFAALLLWLLIGDTLEFAAFVRYGVAIIPLFVYSVGFCRMGWEKPAFLVLFSYNLHSTSFLAAICMFRYIQPQLDRIADVNSEHFIEEIYVMVALGQILLMCAYVLFAACAFYVFYRIGQGFFEMEWQDVVFLSVLNIVGILFAYMVVDLSYVRLETDVFILFDEKRNAAWKIPLMEILLLGGEYAGIYVWKKYRALLAERGLVLARQEQLKQLKERMAETDALYRDIRSARHDMKNHMMTMRGLLARGEHERALEYMKKMDASLDAFDYKFTTGNAVCDVVINGKYRLACDRGVVFKAQFFCQEESGIADYDMAILLGNLLDNAIEAAASCGKDERYVRLELRRKGNFYLIEVKNSYSGTLLFDEGTGLPKSTKREDEHLHGIGLSNVAAIARQYFGTVNIETAEDGSGGQIFGVTVLLERQLEQNNVRWEQNHR